MGLKIVDDQMVLSAAFDESKKLLFTLRSFDGEEFQVEEAVAVQSQTIRSMIDDGCAAGSVIPLPNVNSKMLTKVIEYCKKHADSFAAASTDYYGKRFTVADYKLKNWDTEFVKVDQGTLFDLMLAANYLDIKGLLDLTCQTVADMMKGKSPEQIRKIFKIENDFTPEEEEEIRRENAWAFK